MTEIEWFVYEGKRMDMESGAAARRDAVNWALGLAILFTPALIGLAALLLGG